VREQADRLLREGWLVRSRRRGHTGRPADVYALSQRAKHICAGRADVLARLLLDELAATQGADAAQTFLAGVARRMAELARRAIGEGPVPERVRRLADLLGTNGVIAESDAAGLRLSVYTCPYAGVAGGHPEICEMESEMIRQALGVGVRRRQRMRDGHRICEFELSARAGSGLVKADG